MAGTEAEPHARPRRARRARGGPSARPCCLVPPRPARRAGRLPRSGPQVGRPPPSGRARASRRREDPPPSSGRRGVGAGRSGRASRAEPACAVPSSSSAPRAHSVRGHPAGRAQHAPSFSRGPWRRVSEVPGSRRREEVAGPRAHAPLGGAGAWGQPWVVRCPPRSPGLRPQRRLGDCVLGKSLRR